jgi:glycerophosphoryl diester phosphodiesterase
MKIVAHRGFSSAFPENSIPAFAAAVAAGADEIELDVRVSADGIPFVCHDATLNRVCDLSGLLASLPASALRGARLKAPDGRLVHGIGLATLADALDSVPAQVGLNIHVYELGPARETLAVLRARPRLQGRDDVYVAGGGAVLEAALAACPRITRCCLVDQRAPAKMIAAAATYKCARVQFYTSYCTADNVREALRLGLAANYFFADTAEELDRVAAMGVTHVLTNDPGFARVHLAGSAVGALGAPGAPSDGALR